MNRFRCGLYRNEQGAVAIETAFFLLLLVPLLMLPLLFGRVLLHYSMAQKAAHDAARFLATVPQRDIRWIKPDRGEIGAAALARAIARTEVSEANTGDARAGIDVFCDGETCDGGATPSQIQVIVRMNIFDGLFEATGPFVGDAGIVVRADVTMAYVGK